MSLVVLLKMVVVPSSVCSDVQNLFSSSVFFLNMHRMAVNLFSLLSFVGAVQCITFHSINCAKCIDTGRNGTEYIKTITFCFFNFVVFVHFFLCFVLLKAWNHQFVILCLYVCLYLHLQLQTNLTTKGRRHTLTHKKWRWTETKKNIK